MNTEAADYVLMTAVSIEEMLKAYAVSMIL